MCLNYSMSAREQKSEIDKLEVKEDGYVWLWKVFDVDSEGNLVAQFNDYDFYEGKNTAKGKIVKAYNGSKASYQYTPGFHAFFNKDDAEWWERESKYTRADRIVVPIKVKKSWITTIGFQDIGWADFIKVVVCKHIII